jgi:hypothetical protein
LGNAVQMLLALVTTVSAADAVYWSMLSITCCVRMYPANRDPSSQMLDQETNNTPRRRRIIIISPAPSMEGQ